MAADEPPEVADRTEILRLLSVAGRRGHVPALRLLLNELKRDEQAAAKAEAARKLTLVPDPEPDPEDFIDELAKRGKDAADPEGTEN